MKIPQRFKLFGQTIEVIFTEAPFIENHNDGFASYRLNQIQINPNAGSHQRTEEQQEQTFWHELMHFIVYHAGEANSGKKDYLHQEEGFIDIAGSLLHQAINSFEYNTKVLSRTEDATT